ncbi:hypothetical protein [Treponema sp.]|nr:hypothetical protein [Treponema sp.]
MSKAYDLFKSVKIRYKPIFASSKKTQIKISCSSNEPVKLFNSYLESN